MVAKLRIEDLIPDFAEFVRTSFDLRPVRYDGAMSRRLDLLPTSATLDGLLELDVLPPDHVRLTRAGRGLPRNSHTRLTGEVRTSAVVDRAKVMQLFRSGATLTINDIQQVWPSAREMVRLLSETFACRSEATVFATPAGRAGFAPHADELGVIVLQGEGTKDWRVWPTDLDGPRTNTTFEDGTLGPPILEVTLKPGDVLYLPHGTPHAAAATREQSVHISLGLRPRGWHEIISAIVAMTLDERSRSVFPALTGANVANLAGELTRHLATLRDSLESLDGEQALHSLRQSLVRDLVNTPGGLADLRRLDDCSIDQLFRVTTDAVEVVEDGDERCMVRVDGVTVTLPKVIVSALTSEEFSGRSLTCRQIYPEVSAGRAMSIAKQLSRLGALALVPAGA